MPRRTAKLLSLEKFLHTFGLIWAVHEHAALLPPDHYGH